MMIRFPEEKVGGSQEFDTQRRTSTCELWSNGENPTKASGTVRALADV